MISVDEAKRLAKKNLSPKRYEHTCNVRKLAVKLAKAHGADEKKAALAALLHDIAKELPRDRLLQIFTENAIIAGNAAQRPAPVWHGAAAAILTYNKGLIDALCDMTKIVNPPAVEELAEESTTDAETEGGAGHDGDRAAE